MTPKQQQTIDKTIDNNITGNLFKEITALINNSRKQTALIVNSEISILYWSVGKTIKKNMLQYQKAEYGERVIIELAGLLTQKFGKGWSKQQLWNCLRAAEIIPEKEKIYALLSVIST